MFILNEIRHRLRPVHHEPVVEVGSVVILHIGSPRAHVSGVGLAEEVNQLVIKGPFLFLQGGIEIINGVLLLA